MAQLNDLTATELLALYAQGQASPLEACRACVAHIERWEPQLCATYGFDPSGALAQAAASTQRWLAGTPQGALDGVPVLLKENIATRDVPMPLGSAASLLTPQPHDAPPAARLRGSGAVLLGKTTMPDYGMLSSGLSSFHPLTRNPWNTATNPGGSSAGAGAAAAAGYAPLNLGTDIGGSIRLPAAWCGVFGLKPSLGRVPISPPFAGRVAGPMTRTVTDAALMMQVLSQPDWRDAMSLPHQDVAWLDLERPLRGLRIGLQLDGGWGLAVDPEISHAVRAAAHLFERQGAQVAELAPYITRAMIDGLDHFWRMRSHLDIAALPAERRARILPYILDWVAPAARYSAATVFNGYSQMAAMRDAAVAACQPFDFVLSPVAPIASYPATLPGPSNDAQRPFEHIAFTVAFNMSEQPSASINCGHTESGAPIGLQITGRRHDDLGVLRLARAWEQLRPAQRPWPQP